MYDVFLSYSRNDESIAIKINKKLSDYGLKVFFDQISIHSEGFPLKIAQGIKASKVFLFLASSSSVSSRYAPDELVYAKNHKPRNSIIVYKIDSCTLPDDIEFLLAAINQRDAASDSLDVILDDILYLLSQENVSNIPRVTKRTSVDTSFKELFNAFQNLDYYSVIHQELEHGYWKENWNHHLLLMRAYRVVGDRRNYGILLNMYQQSGIVYYPAFYDAISQVWDMIELGYINETKTHVKGLLSNHKTLPDKVCSEVNFTHILLLSGEHQKALNNYKDILIQLNNQARYAYLLKDFDTLNWLGYNQLNSNVISNISSLLGYKLRGFNTSYQGHLACGAYERLLCSHRWHWKEDRLHFILTFRSLNGIGNSVYYFVEYEKNLLGKVFGDLPSGFGESDTIQSSGRAFCQYRLTKLNNRLFMEEYNPLNEVISSGEIILLNDKELRIKVLYNGNPRNAGMIRKYKALKD